MRSFKDLGRLDDLHRLPSCSTSDPQCTSEDFANLLSDIYSCNDVAEQPCIESLRQLPRFTNREFQIALKSMKLNRCSDQEGIYFEMVKFGGNRVHREYLRLVNELISNGKTDDAWRHSLFHNDSQIWGLVNGDELQTYCNHLLI